MTGVSESGFTICSPSNKTALQKSANLVLSEKHSLLLNQFFPFIFLAFLILNRAG